MSDYYSYHIFYFPFRWAVPGMENKLFSEQVDMDNIPIQPYSMWERVQIDETEKTASVENLQEEEELFAERQYYFNFVHEALYDIKGKEDPIIQHYERKDVKDGNAKYHICCKDKNYELKLEALNLNLYSTGVGIMSFYLRNEKENQKDESIIRDINQFGRRVMPPHCGEFDVNNRTLLAKSISIEGLYGDKDRYCDLFDYAKVKGSDVVRGLNNIWKPAGFIKSLIEDLSPTLIVNPVIDDRMLVNCWYGSNELSRMIKDNTGDFMNSDLWYKHVFVDDGSDTTCQNDEMRKELLKNATYNRWQKYGTLYGVSRYSLVGITDEGFLSKQILSTHLRTIYSRMFELVIIQRASVLRFSEEVTKVSSLKGKDSTEMSRRISSLYKEYIRFVNQIYFRTITVQDQGIELYEMLLKQLDTEEQIKELDKEIEELNQYDTLLIDQRRNENAERLNWYASALLPVTILTGVFGMNKIFEDSLLKSFVLEIIVIIILSIIAYRILSKIKRR